LIWLRSGGEHAVNADQSQDHTVPHQRSGTYDLSGTTVVVTGGNAGIGAALARGVGRAGAAVAIWARNDARNQATVSSLRAEGIEAWSMACDVAAEADVEQAMGATLERFGRVDSLFANAGIADATPYVDTTLADWQRVLRTNLDGSFLTTRAAARHMIERGRGSIVVVSSMVSRYGAARQAAYAVHQKWPGRSGPYPRRGTGPLWHPGEHPGAGMDYHCDE
jgi:NAD(P)-dependent dehydrogenase (short-subunit alcohol dehydrogenase family)